MRSFRLALACLPGILTTFACGGGSSPNPPQGGTGQTQVPSTLTLTLTSAGVDPRTSSIQPGGTLTVTNNDTVAHEFASNPHPQHNDCPELNSPRLAPGTSFTTTLANRNQVCGFHDHLNPSRSQSQGTINVTSGGALDLDAGSDGMGDPYGY